MGLVYNVTKGRIEYLIGLDEGGAGGGGINNKKIIIKSDTIPEANEKTFKLIYIYAGENNGTYHHGYIYECIADVEYSLKYTPDPDDHVNERDIAFNFVSPYTSDSQAMQAWLKNVIQLDKQGISFTQVASGSIIRKTFDDDRADSMWNVILKDKQGNILYQSERGIYTSDLESFGFTFVWPNNHYLVDVPTSFTTEWTISSASNYRWQQLDVQPGGGGGDMSIYQLKANISQDPTFTSQGTYPSSYALSEVNKSAVKSVNFKTPDNDGNVLITQVATAENLVSPDNINDTAYILFRTAGGTKSISDGPATLMKMAGNVINPRRSLNNIDTTHNETTRITASVDATTFGTAVSNVSGDYTFTFDGTNWSYDSNVVNLEDYGITLSATALNGDSFIVSYTYDNTGEEVSEYATATYNAVDRLTIAVNETTFAQKVNNEIGTYSFLYQGAVWMSNEAIVNINEYGITITGTPQTGDTITITYNGDMQVATPTSFQASGFNQFNPTNVLSGYTINENGEIVASAGSYVAYIHAVGGLENNYGNRHGDYTIYDDNTTGTLVRIGYSATIPTTSSTITLSGNDGIEVVNDTSILPANKLQWITFPKDGYICVALTDITKLCVHPTWSNYKDQDYAEYVAPSVINIPTTGYDISDPTQTQVTLNCANYFGKVGNVFDEIFLEDNKYVNRIGRYAYSQANLDTVIELGVDYIYDSNYIYYVLPTPVTYVVDIPDNGKYTVNDFGTEEFMDTTVAVLANTLYGNNLVDKLRTDVLTKSAQSLSQEQKEQVWQNLGLQPIYNHVKELEANGTVTINLVSTKQVYELTPTSDTTLVFNTDNLVEFNAQDSDVEIEFTLYIKMVDAQQAWEITFPDTVVWGNTSPTMTAMANYKFSFCKPKGSNVWIGNQMYSWVE